MENNSQQMNNGNASATEVIYQCAIKDKLEDDSILHMFAQSVYMRAHSNSTSYVETTFYQTRLILIILFLINLLLR